MTLFRKFRKHTIDDIDYAIRNEEYNPYYRFNVMIHDFKRWHTIWKEWIKDRGEQWWLHQDAFRNDVATCHCEFICRLARNRAYEVRNVEKFFQLLYYWHVISANEYCLFKRWCDEAWRKLYDEM